MNTKKRKSDSTGLDEVDRTMYATFCSAANLLSQLYTQSQNQQKLVFQAGERHGLEKLNQWILRRQEEGSRVTVTDIVAFIQNELDYGGEEAPMPPTPQLQQNPNPNASMLFSTPMVQMTHGAFGPVAGVQGSRSAIVPDQAKNSVFSLQPYHMAQGGYYSGRRAGYVPGQDNQFFHSEHESQIGQNEMNTGDSRPQDYTQESHQNRDTNLFGSQDSTMDMNAEGSPHQYYQ